MMSDIPHPSTTEGRPWEEMPEQHRYIQKVSVKAGRSERENSGVPRAEGHGGWAVPRIEVWIGRLGKAALGKLVNE